MSNRAGLAKIWGTAKAAAFGSMLAVVGCGAGGGNAIGNHGGAGTSGASDDGGAACGPLQIDQYEQGSVSGTMSWRDNGALECGSVATVDHMVGAQFESLFVTSYSSDGDVDFTVSTGAPGLGGTFTCGNGSNTAPTVFLEARGPQSNGFEPSSDCTITVQFSTDAAGAAHVRGTFSGTAAAVGLGTDLLTQGQFDLVTQTAPNSM